MAGINDITSEEWDRAYRSYITNREYGPMCSPSKPAGALDKQVAGNHYKSFKIQPIEFIQANKLSYEQGNVVKYVTRYKNKNGVEDLEKAKHYIDLLIEYEKKETSNGKPTF